MLSRTPRARGGAEAAFLAIGDGAALWLTEAGAAGATRVRAKMAEAVELARLHPTAVVDRALGQAATAGRFADGDLAAILTHQATSATSPLGWDQALSSIPTQAALRTLEWIGRAENMVVCGPAGTGKHVAWFTLEALGVLVRRHRADDSVTKAITRILRADLVIIDDIGLLPVGPDAAEGLTDSSTPPTNAAASRSPRICTPPDSTSSCPRP